MKTLSSLCKRKAVRQAAKASSDAAAEAALAQQGITIGEPRTLSGPELLELLDQPDDSEPSVTITVYLADSPGAERYRFEDALSDLLEAGSLGEWVGGGQGDMGDGTFFDITFSVRDFAAAVPLIQQQLGFLGAGPRTTIQTSDGREFGLA
jgi:hypothetical protein